MVFIAVKYLLSCSVETWNEWIISIFKDYNFITYFVEANAFPSPILYIWGQAAQIIWNHQFGRVSG